MLHIIKIVVEPINSRSCLNIYSSPFKQSFRQPTGQDGCINDRLSQCLFELMGQHYVKRSMGALPQGALMQYDLIIIVEGDIKPKQTQGYLDSCIYMYLY